MAKEIYYQICPYCNQEAFYYRFKPYLGLKLEGKNVIKNKDDKIIIRCKKCRKIIHWKYISKKYLGSKCV